MNNKLQAAGLVYGLFFICFASLSFIPCMAPNGFLFNLFFVNPLVNTLHLVTGIFAVWASFQSVFSTKLFFQIAGFIYGAITILGFACQETTILGILANNMADSWMDLIVTIVSLYFGFYFKNPRKKSN